MNLNKVFMAGRLVRDPELGHLPSGDPVCNFTIAVNSGYGQNEKVCYIDCVAFKRRAENINQYLSKGKPIFIEGELRQEKWTGKDNKTRSRYKITIWSFQFLGDTSRRNEDEQNDQPLPATQATIMSDHNQPVADDNPPF